jgi:phospholipid-binding lipoprotein MlaA
VGVVGYGDPARDWWAIELHDADLGQTLGRYGCGTSIYFVWPFLGPSNVRDTAGYAGDTFLNPLTYILPEFYWTVAVKAHETVNTTSLRAGEYEDFKNASIDPYVAMRDAYAQYRKNFVNNVKDPNGQPAGPLQTH